MDSQDETRYWDDQAQSIMRLTMPTRATLPIREEVSEEPFRPQLNTVPGFCGKWVSYFLTDRYTGNIEGL